MTSVCESGRDFSEAPSEDVGLRSAEGFPKGASQDGDGH